MIEKTAFGSMTIDGRKYASDLMILPDGGVQDRWRRKSGHVLSLADLGELIRLQPAIIVVGMGIFGRMKPAPDLHEALNRQGIGLVAAWTRQAAEQFNQLAGTGGSVAACFHLTC